MIITEKCVFSVDAESGLTLTEIAAGTTLADVMDSTGCEFKVAGNHTDIYNSAFTLNNPKKFAPEKRFLTSHFNITVLFTRPDVKRKRIFSNCLSQTTFEAVWNRVRNGLIFFNPTQPNPTVILTQPSPNQFIILR